MLTQPIKQLQPPVHAHNKSYDYNIDSLGYSSMPYLYPNLAYDSQMTPMSYYNTPYLGSNDFHWDDGTGYYYPGMPSTYYPENEAGMNEEMRKRSFEGEVGKPVFAINLFDVLNKKDLRTTIMIKNIPNKYTQKMLLKKIDKKFKHAYDFFYLPIDLKNKCNVGYAFINFINPLYILRFFEEFNGQRWEKFKSEKICQLAYARIQGHQALLLHFRLYDSVFQQSMKVRPLIFPERKMDIGELAEYEKRLRLTITVERINELTRLNYEIFGKK